MLHLRLRLFGLSSPRCLDPKSLSTLAGATLRPASTGMYAMQVGMVMAKVRAAINGDAPTALFFKAPTISGGIWWPFDTQKAAIASVGSASNLLVIQCLTGLLLNWLSSMQVCR